MEATPNFAKILRAFANPDTYTSTPQSLIVLLLTKCSVSGICTHIPPETTSLLWKALDLELLQKFLSGEFQDELVQKGEEVFKMNDRVADGSLTAEEARAFRSDWIQSYQYSFERLAATLQALSILEEVLLSDSTKRAFSLENQSKAYEQMKRRYREEKSSFFNRLIAAEKREVQEILRSRDSRFEGSLNSGFMFKHVERATRRAVLALDPIHLYGLSLDFRIIVRVAIEFVLNPSPDY